MTSANQNQKPDQTPLPSDHPIHRMPDVTGKLRANVPLAPLTWFRVGGPAEVLFRPKDVADLQHFLKHCPSDIPITIIGATSNLLVRDGGISGVVVRLAGNFARIEMLDDTTLYAGAAALDMSVANFAADKSCGGLEFLSGIPGSIGGGLRMNAGAYGTEFKDVLRYADVIDGKGKTQRWTPEDMDMQYRHNNVPEDIIFTGAAFHCQKTEEDIIRANMAEIKSKRENSQPIREKTGGSTFANPCRDNPDIDKHAWQLVDEAGCRGFSVGGAQMSEKHCNFMINTGDATAADIENLGETVRQKVLDMSGIPLRWEIRRIGQALDKNSTT